MKVTELHDLVGVTTTLKVLSPVATLRGPKEVDHDDDVEIEITLPGWNSVKATISVDQYLSIKKAVIKAR
jgi:hypothetical protein